jgi:outer membrane immunogenic protein
MQQTTIKTASIVLVLGLVATAQESRSEIGMQGIGLSTQNSGGNSVTRSATDTGGGLASYRYHINRWLSLEAAYGYGRNTQKFSTDTGVFGQQANVNQMTAGLVANLPVAPKWKISPHLLAEGGALICDPTGNAYGTASGSAQRQNRGAFVYGGGLSVPITKRIGLRAEYRGLVF